MKSKKSTPLQKMMSVDLQLAKQLLEIQAVKVQPDQPFTWSSGWKSPIYCDNRITLSYPKIRKTITENLASLIQNHIGGIDSIAGVATAGIAQGALVADLLEVPFCYVRPEPKKHGLSNQIEGFLKPNSNVVLVEDLISTGGSSLRAAQALIDFGVNVLGVVAIFNYGLPIAFKNFTQKNIPFFTLTSYPTLIELCEKEHIFSTSQLESLKKWNIDPENWQ